MASSGIRTPRSVSDATRFTSTTPHAASKGASATSASSAAAAAAATSSSSAPLSRFGSGPAGRRHPAPAPPPSGGHLPAETPEQRVARLRAAHLAAKNAQVSRMDRFVDRARGFFDTAHRVTTIGLISLSVVAALVTAYAAVDMMTHNRKRKAEFLEAQRRMQADSLEAARLAYMRGDATEEQARLVEEANERGAETSIFNKVPSVIGAPTPVKPPSSSGGAAADVAGQAGAKAQAGAAVAAAATGATKGAAERSSGGGGGGGGWGSGIWGFLGGNLKAEDDAAPARLAGAAVLSSIEDRARAAFDKERENQQKGGLLDQVGNETKRTNNSSSSNTSEKPKKGWW